MIKSFRQFQEATDWAKEIISIDKEIAGHHEHIKKQQSEIEKYKKHSDPLVRQLGPVKHTKEIQNHQRRIEDLGRMKQMAQGFLNKKK